MSSKNRRVNLEDVPEFGNPGWFLSIDLSYQFENYTNRPRGYYIYANYEEHSGGFVKCMLMDSRNSSQLIEATKTFSQKRFDAIAASWKGIKINDINVRDAMIAVARSNGFKMEVKADEVQG
jgi:hypothetical protein